MAHPGAPRGRRHVNAGPRATASPTGRIRTVAVVSEEQRDKLDELATALGLDRGGVLRRLIELDTADTELDVFDEGDTYEALSA